MDAALSPFLNTLIHNIHQTLLPALDIESRSTFDPVVANSVPSPWQLLGTGNYAAVLYHPNYLDYVVKIYAPGRPGWPEEVNVYQRLGQHPAFSTCFHAEPNFLVLKRLEGMTLYDSLAKGIVIPKQVIQEIDQALSYACDRGLKPHDIHGRNALMKDGKGFVVDVSDFLKPEPCTAWHDLKWAYRWIYSPLIAPLRLRVPYQLLDYIRWSYRWFRRLTKRKPLS